MDGNSEPDVVNPDQTHLEAHKDDSNPSSSPPTCLHAQDAGNGDRNPTPPSELIKHDVIDADNIGDTVFSKHKLFTLLMKLIQTVDGVPECQQSDGSTLIDLDETFQDELCNLWDMSMNSEVVCLLREFKAIDILTGIISKSCVPRATEICVGILGNMACSSNVCRDIADDHRLVDLILSLLESPDAPTLVETTRLLNVCISAADKPTSGQWLAAISKQTDMFSNIVFILCSSTNNDLLRNCVHLADRVMDADATICDQWSGTDLVRALLEAIKQAGCHPSETFDTILHILQLVSTTETGMKALVSDCDAVCHLCQSRLTELSSDDILDVRGRHHVIASSLSVLSAVLPAWPGCRQQLVDDFQLMRCLLKLIEAVVSLSANSKGPSRTESRANADDGECGTEADDMMRMLRDLLSDIFVQMVVSLSEISSDASTDHQGELEVPKSLRYLDSMCSRQRIHCLVSALRNNADSHVKTLKETATRWHLERLPRIVSDSMS